MIAKLQTTRAKLIVLLFGMILLMISMLCSLLYGIHTFSLDMLWNALVSFDGSTEHIIMRTVRIPAALIAAAVGASLAIAGTLMQVVTKNPLASPSIFGINAGAVLFIVLGLTWFSTDMSLDNMVWIAFLGASITAFIVITLGSAGKYGFTPVKITLAGAAVSALASSITSGIMLINNESLNQAMFWLVGSISGREMDHLIAVTPYLFLGWMIALFLGKPLNVMAMGDDVAKGLGQRTAIARGLTMIVVILLAGASVSLAGPIAFIGIMVPHACRYFTGNDHYWLIPYSAVFGALLLVSADTVSRLIMLPKEIPVGVTTALLGVPFLISIARRRTHE